MVDNFPYISSDYFTEKYQPFDLAVTKEEVYKNSKPEFRNEIEYLYVIEGRGKIEINHQVIIIQQGDFIQLMPYHVHRFIFEEKESIHMFRIRFSIGLLIYTSTNQENYLKSIGYLEKSLPVVSLDDHGRRRVTFICEEMIFEKSKQSSGLEALSISLISLISYVYYSHQREGRGVKASQSLGGLLLQYLQFHHQEQLTVNRLATHFSMSEKEVKEALKDLTGFTFSQLLNQVRIRNAVALTQFESLSTNQIGKICGYQTDSAFYKNFKESTGTTPDNYREESRLSGKIGTDTFEIVLYLIEHATESLSLKRVSTDLNLSEKKINRLLNSHFQMGYKEYSHYIKMSLAQNILSSLSLDVEEVALLFGYEDPHTFSRNFKKITGTLPSEW